jgi:hypothetical protein
VHAIRTATDSVSTKSELSGSPVEEGTVPLTSATIKQSLASVPAVQRDNAAQTLIQNASLAELRDLDAEGVLRLYQALAMEPPRIYSSKDDAAVKRLRQHTQFQPVKATPAYGVDLVKRASLSFGHVQTQLSAAVITRVYAAERSRLSMLERMGIDGETVGRGQLGQAAYSDVIDPAHYKLAWEACLTQVHSSDLLLRAPSDTFVFDFGAYRVKVPPLYSAVYSNPVLEDFVVAGYLAIRLQAASKAGAPRRIPYASPWRSITACGTWSLPLKLPLRTALIGRPWRRSC